MANRAGLIGTFALVALLALPAWADNFEHGGGPNSGGGAPHGSPSSGSRPPGLPAGPHGSAPFRSNTPGPRENDFHGRDFHNFGPHELETWHSGEWHHDWHNGRYGWWWWAGGFWYFYTDPIFPYPDYISPEMVDAPPDPGAAAPPATPEDETGAPPSWYYCDAAKGYYPYVPACPTGWREVPAKPPDAP